MKLKPSILIILTLILFGGCLMDSDRADAELTIVNNSNQIIVHYDELKFPNDTALSTIAFQQTPGNTASRLIYPHDHVTEKAAFKRILNRNRDRAFMLYLFSRDTIEQVPWDRIVDEYLVLRRYDLTLEDLEAMNWVVEYP